MTDFQKERIAAIEKAEAKFRAVIIAETVPGRERALALTNLDQVMHWAKDAVTNADPNSK